MKPTTDRGAETMTALGAILARDMRVAVRVGGGALRSPAVEPR